MSVFFDKNNLKILHAECDKAPGILQAESIDLVVTSPPYGVGIDYENHNDAVNYDEYLNFTSNWLHNCHYWLKPNGRIAINVPFETAKYGKQAVYADVLNIAKKWGFKHYTTAIWLKGNVPRVSWGCYDDRTKVLTNRGLKLFKDIDIKNDLFATYNLSTHKLEYQKALKYIEHDYNGEMYSIKNKTTNLVITPDHNMISLVGGKRQTAIIKPINQLHYAVLPSKHGGYDDGKEEPIFILPSVRINNKYDTIPIKIKMDTWLKFLGIFLTDGYCECKPGKYSVRIYQTKKLFLKEIQQLLKEMPFDFKFRASKCEYTTCNKQLAKYLSQFGKKNYREMPNFIDKLSLRQKRVFVDWLWKGDGNHYNNGSWRVFFSVSIKIVDKLLNYLTQLNYGLHVVLKQPDGKIHLINGKDIKQNFPIYLVYVKRSKTKWIENSKINKINYNGKIYCVSVPNRTLLVERDGQLTWCGNSPIFPKAPLLIPPAEALLIMHKGVWNLPDCEGKVSDISKDDFYKWTDCCWKIVPASAKKIGHPVPFPEELVRRCIKLLTFVGDTILDPFLGSGTSLVSAYKNNRKGIGIEMSEIYCELSKKRLEREFTIQAGNIF